MHDLKVLNNTLVDHSSVVKSELFAPTYKSNDESLQERFDF